jgi:hypothetical protein
MRSFRPDGSGSGRQMCAIDRGLISAALIDDRRGCPLDVHQASRYDDFVLGVSEHARGKASPTKLARARFASRFNPL